MIATHEIWAIMENEFKRQAQEGDYHADCDASGAVLDGCFDLETIALAVYNAANKGTAK